MEASAVSAAVPLAARAERDRRPALGAYAAYALAAAAIAVAFVHLSDRRWAFGGRGEYLELAPAPLAAAALLLAALGAAALLARVAAGRPVPLAAALAARLARVPAWSVAAGIAVLAAAASLAVAVLVLDRFPNSGDEHAYVFQAETYLLGRLWADAPPTDPAFFRLSRVLIGDGIWVGQYPPGWSATMAAGSALLGLPLHAVNPLLGTALVLAFFALARRHGVPDGAALLAAASLAGSAFFLFTQASFFSHGASALAAVAFALAGRAFLDRPGWAVGLAAGAALGYAGLARPVAAVVLALPFAVELILRARPLAPALLRSGWIALGGLPFLAALLAFQDAVTGHPLLAVPNWHGAEPERLVPPGELAAKLVAWRAALFAAWTSPLLALAAPLAFLALWRARARLDFADWYPPLAVGFYLLYPGIGGNQYGPRYYYEAYPFVLLTVAKALAAHRAAGGTTDAAPAPLLDGPWGPRLARALPHLVAAHLVFQAVALPPRVAREGEVVRQRQDVYHLARDAGLDRAVVLLRAGTGAVRRMRRTDLARNPPTLDAPVLYVHDLPGREGELLRAFPGRSLHAYERDGRDAPRGRLVPVPVPTSAAPP